jgi:hypothetical protein
MVVLFGNLQAGKLDVVLRLSSLCYSLHDVSWRETVCIVKVCGWEALVEL